MCRHAATSRRLWAYEKREDAVSRLQWVKGPTYVMLLLIAMVAPEYGRGMPGSSKCSSWRVCRRAVHMRFSWMLGQGFFQSHPIQSELPIQSPPWAQETSLKCLCFRELARASRWPHLNLRPHTHNTKTEITATASEASLQVINACISRSCKALHQGVCLETHHRGSNYDLARMYGRMWQAPGPIASKLLCRHRGSRGRVRQCSSLEQKRETASYLVCPKPNFVGLPHDTMYRGLS